MNSHKYKEDEGILKGLNQLSQTNQELRIGLLKVKSQTHSLHDLTGSIMGHNQAHTQGMHTE